MHRNEEIPQYDDKKVLNCRCIARMLARVSQVVQTCAISEHYSSERASESSASLTIYPRQRLLTF